MDGDEVRTMTHPPEHETPVFRCHKCGWPFPNHHPSAKHRRAHKKVCGALDGYKLIEPDRDEEDSGNLKRSESFESGHKMVGTEEDEFADAALEFTETVASPTTKSLEVTTEPLEVSETLERTEDESGYASAISPAIGPFEKNNQTIEIVTGSTVLCIGQAKYMSQNEDSEHADLYLNSDQVGDTAGETGIGSSDEIFESQNVEAEVNDYASKDTSDSKTSTPDLDNNTVLFDNSVISPIKFEEPIISSSESSIQTVEIFMDNSRVSGGQEKCILQNKDSTHVYLFDKSTQVGDATEEIGIGYPDEAVSSQNIKAVDESPPKDVSNAKSSIPVPGKSTVSLPIEMSKITKDENGYAFDIEAPANDSKSNLQTVEVSVGRSRVCTLQNEDSESVDMFISSTQAGDATREVIIGFPEETVEEQNTKTEAKENVPTDTPSTGGSLEVSEVSGTIDSKDHMEPEIPIVSGCSEVREDKENYYEALMFGEVHSCPLPSTRIRCPEETVEEQNTKSEAKENIPTDTPSTGGSLEVSEVTGITLNSKDPMEPEILIISGCNEVREEKENHFEALIFGEVHSCPFPSKTDESSDVSSSVEQVLEERETIDTVENACIKQKTDASECKDTTNDFSNADKILVRDSTDSINNNPVSLQNDRDNNLLRHQLGSSEVLSSNLGPASDVAIDSSSQGDSIEGHWGSISDGTFSSTKDAMEETNTLVHAQKVDRENTGENGSKEQKKNEQIITKVTKRTEKPHNTLKSLLVEGQDEKNHKAQDGAPLEDPMSVLDVNHEKLDRVMEQNSPQTFKGEKRRTKGKPLWVSLLCCLSVS
uniref:C2H2-type domain-containing protein n=1 Tax=Nelumbo nucifera TaxID=4432 RepID=A0A822XZ87_NELNU|nr:TPA_asm: hypothetical protein HUJ06_025578 [Nelumbo nucifera]